MRTGRCFLANKRGAGSGQRGLSLIELLVGVAVGLIVVAGAVKLAIDALGSNRRMLLETRINQDLRAAADLIARDIRRSGYWQNAASGVFTSTGTTVTSNPYSSITVDANDANRNAVAYEFSRDANNAVDFNEHAGFRVTSGGVLEFRNDPDGSTERWLAVTDPKVVTITKLTIAELSPARTVELSGFCNCLTKLTCAAADFQPGGTYYDPTDPTIPKRPLMTIRQFDIVLAAQSATDPGVQREIRETVRVRNDVLSGRCPNL